MHAASILLGILVALLGASAIVGAIVFGIYLVPFAVLGVLMMAVALFLLMPYAIAEQVAGGPRGNRGEREEAASEPSTGAVWYLGLFVDVVALTLAVPELGSVHGKVLLAFGAVFLVYLFSPKVRKRYLRSASLASPS